jgi:Metallo-beta-lactamase superfamily
MGLQAIFQFQPVGQGCFYTGSLNYQGQEFNMVYDCGTVSDKIHIEHAVHIWATGLQQRKLDMLIISHFDYDHVNGIRHLLTHFGSCDTAIIPYVHPSERLLMMASMAQDENGNRDEDYIDFLKDPVDYLTRLNVGRIIVIDTPDNNEPGDQDTNPPDLPPEPPSPDREIKFWIDNRLFSSQRLREKALKEYPPHALQNRNAEYVTHAGALYIGMIWRFRFYVLPQSKENKDLFLSQLNAITKGPVDTIAQLTAFSSKATLQSIRASYLESFGDVNATSLVVYHEPITVKPVRQTNVYIYCLKYKSSHIIPAQSAIHSGGTDHILGTLLTGDIPLKGGYYFQVKEHFKKEIRDIAYFQVPHHGSKNNWNGLIKNDISPFVYIVNHGLINRHKHPSKEVETDLKERNLLHNTESAQVQYYLTFDFV